MKVVPEPRKWHEFVRRPKTVETIEEDVDVLRDTVQAAATLASRRRASADAQSRSTIRSRLPSGSRKKNIGTG